MDYSPPGSSVHGISQGRILKQVVFPAPGLLPDPGIKPLSLASPALADGFFTSSATWEALAERQIERLIRLEKVLEGCVYFVCICRLSFRAIPVSRSQAIRILTFCFFLFDHQKVIK